LGFRARREIKETRDLVACRGFEGKNKQKRATTVNPA